MTILQEKAPHLRRKDNLSMMMIDVVIALLPVMIFSLIVFKVDALRNMLLSVATMELCEFVFVLIMNRLPYDGKKHSFKEKITHALAAYSPTSFLVPLVSALIYSLILPAQTNPPALIYYVIITGALFGEIIGKLVFGGTGKNIFNPAATGMVFVKLCFGSKFVYPTTTSYYDITTGATPLGSVMSTIGGGMTFNVSQYSLLDLFLGKVPGAIGETCKVAILIGLIYLILRHTIDFRIPLSYIGFFVLLSLFAGIIIHARYADIGIGDFIGYQLLSGGLLFGATYMATDPVTSPLTRPGKLAYGAILAVSTFFIRLFGALPEGVAFSILIANTITPLIDYRKWATSSYNWKNLLAISLIVVVALLVLVWALCVEVFR
jgi:Na+-translocating ferredoxin:NAD+ oxidoreductase subunit D